MRRTNQGFTYFLIFFDHTRLLHVNLDSQYVFVIVHVWPSPSPPLFDLDFGFDLDRRKSGDPAARVTLALL